MSSGVAGRPSGIRCTNVSCTPGSSVIDATSGVAVSPGDTVLHADAVLAELQGGGLAEADHARLGRRVRGAEEHRHARVQRGDVDDRPAAALLDHLPRRVLDAQEHALQAQVDREVPVLLTEVHDQPGPRRPGHVERGVHGAEPLDGEADQCGHVVLHRHVAGQRRHGIAELVGQRRQAVGHDVAGDDRAALGRDAPGDRPADAGAGAGHERHLALEAVRHGRDLLVVRTDLAPAGAISARSAQAPTRRQRIDDAGEVRGVDGDGHPDLVAGQRDPGAHEARTGSPTSRRTAPSVLARSPTISRFAGRGRRASPAPPSPSARRACRRHRLAARSPWRPRRGSPRRPGSARPASGTSRRRSSRSAGPRARTAVAAIRIRS